MGDDDVQMRVYGGSFQREDEDRVLEWEDGLPNIDDLTPLSQYMISSELASAFRITPETFRSATDVNRASQTTMTTIRRHNQDNFKSYFPNFTEDQSPDPVVVEGDEDEEAETEEISMKDGSDSRKVRRTDNNNTEEGYSALGGPENSKRARLVWTPQLHKRFVDVVGHLGIKSAVPKTIMQLMNVEGLTRENVASHLQKYRLYLKRMQGLSNEGPSSSDPLFATTPVPQNLHESNGQGNVPIHPMPYGGGSMMSMPAQGMDHGHGHMGNQGGNSGPSSYHGFQSHQYNMLREQQREWSGHMFNSMSSYPYVNPNDK